MKTRFYLLLAALFIIATTSFAEIKLPSIFGSGMLLQQNATVKISGKADPGKRVTLLTSWNLMEYSTVSDKDGNWKMAFTTGKAGGPHVISISDGKVLTLDNILLGELWLCSGQSNMEMPMKGFPNQPVEGSNMDILKSTNPNIRLFTVKRNANIHPQDDVTGSWSQATPQTVREFSATAYYFGRLLNEMLGVPVGLLVSSWGGSSIEAWMDQTMLIRFPEAEIPKSNENLTGLNQKPTMLYQAMIHPLLGLPIKGVIWYQGESNASRAHSYAAMFKSMVDGWRRNWNLNNDFPFYYCQIAPYQNYRNLNSAFLREAQMKAEKMVNNVGMAVLMDAGEAENIHPAKKREAGERMALLALNKTYDIQGIAAVSPQFKGISISNDTVMVQFDNAPLGLAAPNFQSKLFQVAGADGIYHPARARVVRTGVQVISDAVKAPVSVQYAFENYVVGDLFSTEGLPVSSFRSK
jgi:sialate O-acetylesterase